MIICLIEGEIKKISLHESSFCAQPDLNSRNKIKFEKDLPNYPNKI